MGTALTTTTTTSTTWNATKELLSTPGSWFNLDYAEASQSSTNFNGRSAWKAINGNAHWPEDCTLTRKSRNPWWQVDLGIDMNISAVAVTAPVGSVPEQVGYFEVYVDNIICASHQLFARSGQIKLVACKGVGRSVKLLIRRQHGYLEICDFKVRG